MLNWKINIKRFMGTGLNVEAQFLDTDKVDR